MQAKVASEEFVPSSESPRGGAGSDTALDPVEAASMVSELETLQAMEIRALVSNNHFGPSVVLPSGCYKRAQSSFDRMDKHFWAGLRRNDGRPAESLACTSPQNDNHVRAWVLQGLSRPWLSLRSMKRMSTFVLGLRTRTGSG